MAKDQTFPCHDRENVWRPARLDPRYPHVLGNTVRTCSFCGSMHPDDVMVGVRDGTFQVGPTDKNYKAYIHLALTDSELAAKRVELEAQVLVQYPDDSFCDEHTPEEMAQARARWIEQSLTMGGTTIGKFYFEHLSMAQRQEFLDLYLDKTMKVGYPGHFYQLPFFMRRVGEPG